MPRPLDVQVGSITTRASGSQKRSGPLAFFSQTRSLLIVPARRLGNREGAAAMDDHVTVAEVTVAEVTVAEVDGTLRTPPPSRLP